MHPAVHCYSEEGALLEAEPGRISRIEQHIRGRRALGNGRGMGAQFVAAEDLRQRQDEPLFWNRRKGRRNVRKPRWIRRFHRFDQPHARQLISQGTSDFLLKFVDRLIGVPTRRPKLSDDRGRDRTAAVALHGKRERRIGIGRGRRLVHRQVRVHRCSPAVSFGLPCNLLSHDAQGG